MIQFLHCMQPEAAGQGAICRGFQEEDSSRATVHQSHGAHEAGLAKEVNVVASA